MEGKTSLEEGGDVYLDSSSKHANHDVWLIGLGASFHMNLHREWFCEYEKYNGGNIYLGDDLTSKITGYGKVKLLLWDGKIRTLPGVLQIPKLARNLIFISKMSDVAVQIVFGNETCKMVRGEMVLTRLVQNGTLYKLLGNTIVNGCNSYIVLEGGNEEDKTPTSYGRKTILWHQRLGTY